MDRIAILSDIHFGKFSRTSSFYVPGEENQDKSKEVYSLEEGLITLLQKMNTKYFFVTGDLTSLGNPQEFFYCEKKILEIAHKVGVDEKDIFCVLGNHDIDWNITKLGTTDTVANDELRKLVMNKYQMIAANCGKIIMDKLGKNYKVEGPAPFSGVAERTEFVVFVLNTGWYCTHDQEFAHGKLDENQLEWFGEITRKYKDDERVKILLMHHHPYNYPYPIPIIDISTIEEGPELMDIASQNGINIIIHGHRHHPYIKTIKLANISNPVTMICSGSLSVNAAHRDQGEIPNTVHFLELSGGREYQTIYNYKFTDAAGWEKIDRNSKVTPIDAEMKIGKIYSQDEIRNAIEKYQKSADCKLCWSELDECLQFIGYGELNSLFSDILRSTHEIVGKFPDPVVLLKK